MTICRAPLRGAMGSGSWSVDLLHLVAPFGGDFSNVNVTNCRTPFGGARGSASVLGPCTTYSGATKCRADLRSAVGGTTSSGLAPLGILHVARPFGALRGVVSMRQNVAAPSGG